MNYGNNDNNNCSITTTSNTKRYSSNCQLKLINYTYRFTYFVSP